MEMLKSFNEFINEATIAANPADTGNLVGILNKYIGKKEEGRNAGPMVKGFLSSVGLGVGNPWCMAFVYSIFDEFCKAKGVSNPLPKTGGVLYFWGKVQSENKIKPTPLEVHPGQIFIKRRKGGGHTGIVIKVEGDSFISIDGNSSDMVKLNKYKISDMLGFVDYFKDPKLSDGIAKLASTIISKNTPTLGGGKEV